MTHRNVHYEAAFEDFLRCKGWPYIAVDEAKRAVFADIMVKNFDFLVYSPSGPNLLLDVKGRKFPGPIAGRKRGGVRAWENWITKDDIDGLTQWQGIFGPDFVATLVFAYWLQGQPRQSPFKDVHLFRRRNYAFIAISLDDYVAASRPRSTKWQTRSMPSEVFSKQARDIEVFL